MLSGFSSLSASTGGARAAAALVRPAELPLPISTGDFPAVTPLRAAIGCRCPRCGKGRLFAGLLKVRQACEICGLDLSEQDAGDGPAVFAILFLGMIVVGLAALVEIKLAPPIWVHLGLWTPLILAGSEELRGGE